GDQSQEFGDGGGTAPDSDPGRATFELTDKAIDFLGYRTLRDVLGGAGRSSVGAHDTRFSTTGIETVGASKEYEFGDTLTLDVPATLIHAAARTQESGHLDLQEGDLMVQESEYHSS